MWCAACRLRGGVGIKLQQIACPGLEWSANNTMADDWLTVQLIVCVCHCVLRPQPFSRCLSSCQLQRPWPTSRCHYDTGSGCCVPLLHRSICRLQCYLEAASGWFDLFDVPHQWRTVVLHYTAITCSRRSTADGRGRSRSVGRYRCWYRGNYYRYRYETDTSSIGRYPIPVSVSAYHVVINAKYFVGCCCHLHLYLMSLSALYCCLILTENLM